MMMSRIDGCLPGVLIVDDVASVRSFIRTALEPTAEVDEAADAERALEVLEGRANATALVLVDQVLPGRSGLEFVRIIKSKWPQILVAIITGFGSEELAVQALRAGANDYLRKPITVPALLHSVARLLSQRAEMAPRVIPEVVIPYIDGSRSPVHPNIGRALAFISKHFAESLSLADAAREAGLSRFHFCRLFHSEMGVPFHEYLHNLRVRHAKVLLADSYLRVSEIAYAVGFNDLSHFDRIFRKHVGRSPSEYRASVQCA
jgi:two-component system, response regulator YesN